MPTTSRPKVVAVTALVAAGLSLTACSSGSTDGAAASTGGSKQITIGFSPITLQAPALQGLAKGVEGYAKSKGYKVLVADPKSDPATQQQQINGWIQRGQIDALWVLPVSPGALSSSIKTAQQKGVAVLAAGLPSDYGMSAPGAGLSFSSVDYVKYGTTLGSELAACVTERLGGKAEVINVIEPANGGKSSAQTAQAIKDSIAKDAPGADIVAEVSSGGDRLKAQQNVASALQAHPDANAIVATNDEAALGALGAFEAAGHDPKKACIVAAGGGDEALGDVKSGKLYAELAFDFQGDLVQNVDMLATMAKDPKTVGKQLDIPLNTVKG